MLPFPPPPLVVVFVAVAAAAAAAAAAVLLLARSFARSLILLLPAQRAKEEESTTDSSHSWFPCLCSLFHAYAPLNFENFGFVGHNTITPSSSSSSLARFLLLEIKTRLLLSVWFSFVIFTCSFACAALGLAPWLPSALVVFSGFISPLFSRALLLSFFYVSPLVSSLSSLLLETQTGHSTSSIKTTHTHRKTHHHNHRPQNKYNLSPSLLSHFQLSTYK